MLVRTETGLVSGWNQVEGDQVPTGHQCDGIRGTCDGNTSRIRCYVAIVVSDVQADGVIADSVPGVGGGKGGRIIIDRVTVQVPGIRAGIHGYACGCTGDGNRLTGDAAISAAGVTDRQNVIDCDISSIWGSSSIIVLYDASYVGSTLIGGWTGICVGGTIGGIRDLVTREAICEGIQTAGIYRRGE